MTRVISLCNFFRKGCKWSSKECWVGLSTASLEEYQRFRTTSFEETVPINTILFVMWAIVLFRI